LKKHVYFKSEKKVAFTAGERGIGEHRASFGRRALALIGALTVALLLTASSNGRPWKVDVPQCALGHLPPALQTLVPKMIAADERRYVSTLGPVGPTTRERAGHAFATAEAAYVFGMPTVLLRLTVQRFPRNLLVGVGQLATPESRTVVAPNHDTLYSVSRVDLTDGPMIIDAPATSGRYSVLQLIDAYTNAFAYVGSGSERNDHQTVALVAPGWQGSLPAGVRVIESPNRLVWLLGRTLVDGPEDIAAATQLMARYSLTPLADWNAGKRQAEIIIPGSGAGLGVELPRGVAFFDALGAALAADPPPPSDDCALASFEPFGIGAGLTPSAATDPLVSGALSAAADAGDQLVDRAAAAQRRASIAEHGGWAFSDADIGRFGTDYAYRAVVARVGLGANVRSEALYLQTDVDGHRRPLDGQQDYVITFAAGGLPPVRAFWSLTLYDQDRFLVANPIDRYSVGDRTGGLRYGDDGSLKIYLQHDPPAGAAAANWLPAPEGPFELSLRLYEPQQAATNGAWSPPTISRVR
jgi:hypothetical protein